MKPINLNQARKAKVRAEAEAVAAANRAKFGRSKLEKQAEAMRADKAAREFAGHRRERAGEAKEPV
jgi:hypothetical protein